MAENPSPQSMRADDVTAVIATLAHAFSTDPVWGYWAFPDAPDRVALLTEFWTPWVVGALSRGGVVLAPGGAAVADWIAPGVAELDEAGEAAVEETTRRLCGAHADRVLEAYELFEANNPAEPHWYLSLLATHPDHRGQGLGMALVADGLRRADEEHVPTYLESTNPANNKRYEAVGFEPYGGFTVPDGPTITTMWRPAR